MKYFFKYMSVGILLFASVGFAHASGIVASQKAELKVINTDNEGKEVISYEPANLVAPGEVVKFTIDFENQQDVSVDNTVLVMPIPKEMDYISHDLSSEMYSTKLSYDGAQTFYSAGVFPNDYDPSSMPVTHVKWEFVEPVKPQMNGSVSAFARLK